MRLLNHDELKEMLRRRLFNRRAKTNFVQKFNEEALDLIVKSAGKNPRKVLEYAEMIFDHHHKRFGDINPILRTDYEVSHHVARQVLEENGVYLEKNKIKKSKVSKIEEKKSDNEQKTQISEGLEKEILQYLNAEPRTVKDVAKQFDLSNNKAKKQIDVLRKNNHLIPKGKKGRMKLWDVNAETKRLLVES